VRTIHLTIKLTPNTSKNEIVGWKSEYIQIRVQSPPIDNKANKALINLIAKELGVKKAQVVITAGQTSRLKRVQVQVEDEKMLPEWVL